MVQKLVFPFSLNNNPGDIKDFESTTRFGYKHQGQDLIDLSLGSCGCFPMGFDRIDFIDNVSTSLAKFPFLSGDFTTTNSHILELSDNFYNISNGYRSIFGINGSNAVEAAIKVVQYYRNQTGSKKELLLGFENSYHGSTYMSSSISGSTYFHNDLGRNSKCRTLAYGSISDIKRQIDLLGSENISCLIIETCSWQNGLLLNDKQWWQQLRELCTQNDIFFIIDDIAFCGFKTGQYFGFDLDISPDIICLGKAMTGGYFPLSNCLINEKLFEVIKDVRFIHGFSYTFNMAGIFSALYYMRVAEEENINLQYDAVKNVSSSIFNNLTNIESVKETRNYGLTWCMDIETNKTEKELFDLFVEEGLYLGLWNNPSKRKQILVHTPNVLDDYYFTEIDKRLTSTFKKI